MISGPGTNFFTRSTVNPKIMVDSKNAGEFAMYSVNDTDSSIPTDVDMFGQGCVLIIEATGLLYINTALDGAAATFVQIGTAPTVLAGDVNGAVGSNTVDSIQGIPPVSVAIYDALITTVGGGTHESVTVAGCLTTDRVYALIAHRGSNNPTLNRGRININGTVDLEFSVDPGNNVIVNLMVTRSTGL